VDEPVLVFFVISVALSILLALQFAAGCWSGQVRCGSYPDLSSEPEMGQPRNCLTLGQGTGIAGQGTGQGLALALFRARNATLLPGPQRSCERGSS
jgi:hypothetical protein